MTYVDCPDIHADVLTKLRIDVCTDVCTDICTDILTDIYTEVLYKNSN